MCDAELLKVMPQSSSCIADRLALAGRLSDAADRIEDALGGDDDFAKDDAVAALRWSAGFLRRTTMREDDLPGALRVILMILKDAAAETLTAGSNELAGGRQKMHERLEQRIELVSAERAEKLYAGLISIADRVGGAAILPEDLIRALRELGLALARCQHDQEGRLKQMELLKVTFPILEEVARYLASHHRHEAAIILRSASEFLADARDS